jgi:hypothetical protein
MLAYYNTYIDKIRYLLDFNNYTLELEINNILNNIKQDAQNTTVEIREVLNKTDGVNTSAELISWVAENKKTMNLKAEP